MTSNDRVFFLNLKAGRKVMTCATERLFCVEKWYGRCVLDSYIVRAVFKSAYLRVWM